MKRHFLSALLLVAGFIGCGTADLEIDDADLESPDADFEPPDADVESRDADFERPVRLKAGDVAIRVESPGYACPALADIKGDGRMHLLVGQFRSGKIQVFPHIDGDKFASGDWLQAEGKVAEVPGVW
jgi:hypothetical protein